MATETELLLALAECFRTEGDRSPEALFWAWDELIEMVRRRPSEGLKIILQLVRSVSDSRTALAKIGAGPLEDLLVFNGSSHLADVIEAANHDPAMKEALLMVWPDGFKNDEVRETFTAWVKANDDSVVGHEG
jgi:hypothetical protein